MKRKCINAIICKKFDQWLENIRNTEVRKLVKENTIATGGAIASMLLGEKPNDFDFYFRDYPTALLVALHYVDEFKTATGNDKKPNECKSITVQGDGTRVKIIVKSAGAASETEADNYGYFENEQDPDRIRMQEFIETILAAREALPAKPEEDKRPKFRPVFLSSNAVSLSDQVQCIIRFYGEPDQIHENYDFAHCTNYWTSWDRKVVLRDNAMEALLTKELRYIGSKYPLCSLFRMKKFLQRGWTVNAGTILKIAWNLQEYNLRDIAVLEEQLTGVDVAYFYELILKLREKNPEKVDGSYLAELIDRMF